MTACCLDSPSTLLAKGKSEAMTPLPTLPGRRATTSPVLGGGGVGWEEDVLDNTGVLLPAAAALACAVNLEGRHCISLASSKSTCTQCSLAQHSPPSSSTSSSPSPKNPSSTAWPYQQSSSLTAEEDRKMPNPQAALLQGRRKVSLHMSRVCARSGWETPSQEGDSTSEEAMKDCVHTTAPRLTCMGSSSTMLIIPSPLDAKWKPSDRRTLAKQRHGGLLYPYCKLKMQE